MSTIAGVRQTSFYEDFYNRIYLDPPALDFQIISADAALTGQIWNANTHSVTLQSIFTTTIDDDQVTTSAGTLPVLITPMAVSPLTVSVTRGGDSRIEGHAAFKFTNGDLKNLEISGVRGILWPFVPNWKEQYNVDLAYKTEIHTSRAGREQRIAQRETPRKTVSFTSHIAQADRRKLNALIDNFQDVSYILADHTRFVRSTSDVFTDETPVTFDDIPSWAGAGDLVVFTYGKKQQVRRIVAINATDKTISFLPTTEPLFLAGAKMCAAMLGSVGSSLQTKRLTNEVVEVNFSFEVTPGYERRPIIPAYDFIQPINFTSNNIFVPKDALYIQFDGRPVLMLKPDWSDPVSLEYNKVINSVDFGKGIVRNFSSFGYGSRGIKMTFTNRSAKITKFLLDTYYRLKGQQKEILIPTWEEDIVPTQSLGAGGTAIRIAGDEFYEQYKNDTSNRYVLITVKASGNQYLRQASAVQKTTGWGQLESVIYINTGIYDEDLSTYDSAIISWIKVCRLASDGLSPSWMTDTKSQMQMVFKTLEYLPAEE